MKKYERFVVYNEPFSIMCGEGEDYETWEPTSEEELRKEYRMDKYMASIDPYMPDQPDTFEEWIEEMIGSGILRETEEQE